MGLITPDNPASDYLPELCVAPGCLEDPAVGERYCRRHLRSRETQARHHQERQLKSLLARIKRISPDIRTKLYAIEIVGSGAVKFGISHNPGTRLSDLQVSHPLPLALLGHIGCDRQLEKDVHLYCSEHRMRGEWFRQEGRAQAILDLIVAGDPVAIYSLVGRDPPSSIF